MDLTIAVLVVVVAVGLSASRVVARLDAILSFLKRRFPS